jgi:hypothetical protein
MVTSYFLILIIYDNDDGESNDELELSEKGLIGLIIAFGEVRILKREDVYKFVILEVVKQD